MRKLMSTFADVLGMALIVCGVALLSVAAAMVVAGVLLLAVNYIRGAE
jgi:hypothetical protein